MLGGGGAWPSRVVACVYVRAEPGLTLSTQAPGPPRCAGELHPASCGLWTHTLLTAGGLYKVLPVLASLPEPRSQGVLGTAPSAPPLASCPQALAVRPPPTVSCLGPWGSRQAWPCQAPSLACPLSALGHGQQPGPGSGSSQGHSGQTPVARPSLPCLGFPSCEAVLVSQGIDASPFSTPRHSSLGTVQSPGDGVPAGQERASDLSLSPASGPWAGWSWVLGTGVECKRGWRGGLGQQEAAREHATRPPPTLVLVLPLARGDGRGRAWVRTSRGQLCTCRSLARWSQGPAPSQLHLDCRLTATHPCLCSSSLPPRARTQGHRWVTGETPVFPAREGGQEQACPASNQRTTADFL